MKKSFITGLIILLPLTITIWSVVVVINWLTNPFMGAVMHLLRLLPIDSEPIIRMFGHLIVFVILFLFTLFIGFAAHKFFIQFLLTRGDQLLNKIPLVRKIYQTAKEILRTLLNTKKKSFQTVVLVNFSGKSNYSFGLIAESAPKTCSDLSQEDLVSVFIPGSPSPLSGFVVLRKRSELIYLDMHCEEALKYIVSCGVVTSNIEGSV